MDSSYNLFGCIDFETDSYAISVPLLKKKTSNYIYIPKTDHNFIAIDFYEVQALGHSIHHLPERAIALGERVPVPILFDGTAYVVEVDWSEAEIRSQHPALDNEAVKAFLSLRKRLASKPAESVHDEIGIELDDLLRHPVRSQYWISKLSALVRSAYEAGDPPESLVEAVEEARQRWLEQLATKSSLKLVTQIMNMTHLQMPEDAAKNVLLKRFEVLVSSKGIYLPLNEIKAHQALFPKGILPAIREVNDQYEYWRVGDKISKLVADQLHDALIRWEHPTEGANADRWSHAELKRLLSFLTLMGAEDFLLERAAYTFHPLYADLLFKLKPVLSNRYEWTAAIQNEEYHDEFRAALARYSVAFPEGVYVVDDTWLTIIGRILEDYRKLITLRKIVWPHQRKKDDDEVAFEELDHTLIDILTRAHQKRRASEVLNVSRVNRLR